MNDSRPRGRWPLIRLGFLFREIDERVGLEAEGIPLLSVSIHRGVLPRAEMTDRESRADDFALYKRVSAGDVVINRMRAFEGGAGISQLEGMVSSDYAVLRPGDRLDARYLHHLIRSRWFVGEMTARLRGIGNVEAGNVRTPRINVEDLGDIRVGLPSRREQHQIADYLDVETGRIDGVVRARRRQIEVLERRTESLLASLFDPMERTHGNVPLKAVADLRFSNVDKKSYAGEIPVLLCNYTDVYYNRRIDRSIPFPDATASPDQVAQLTLRRGDVLLTKDSETAEDIAVAALVTEDLPGVVLGYHLALIRPRLLEGPFLYWALRTRRSRDAFSLAASGVTRFGLRQDAVGRVRIPALGSEAAAIVVSEVERRVRSAEGLVSRMQRQVDLLLERRQSLVSAAVTGQLAIPGLAA